MKVHQILMESTVGSRLHNTHSAESDRDRRIVYRDHIYTRLSPFASKRDTYTDEKSDTTYFELTHFAKMLAKCNPTCIEIVYGIESKGAVPMMKYVAELAMDTEKYVSQCNGMILGMLSRATPKRLHHAARVHTHLTNYVKSGIIEFNAATYGNYSYLMALKRGQVDFDPVYAEKVEVEKVWHTSDLDKLNDLVVDIYMEDVDEF